MTTKITSANITQSGTSGISSVAWQAVQTTGFTAVAGRAYPCDTTSAAFTVTLPASPAAGNVITLTDYAGTWDTNNLTINPNGGKINGSVTNLSISTERGSINLVYVDSTQGWISYASNTAVAPIAFNLEYLVVAGGAGGGGGANSGGGGAGGYKNASGFSVSTQTAYSLIVGGGGAGATTTANGGNGNDSVFSSITSLKGGGGGGLSLAGTGGNGTYGSGGGAGLISGSSLPGGAGTTGQGNSGGNGGTNSTPPGYSGGGGGGSGGAGGAGGSAGGTGVGGTGTEWPIGSGTYYAGGGGGGNNVSVASGGSGVGGNGSAGGTAAQAGATNRGGGGGGGASASTNGGNGGSGVVVLKIPDTRTATFSGGVTSSLSTAVAGYKIYTITNTSTTSETVTFS